MHLVPAAAVRLMKRRVLSRPGVRPLLYHGTPVWLSLVHYRIPAAVRKRPMIAAESQDQLVRRELLYQL